MLSGSEQADPAQGGEKQKEGGSLRSRIPAARHGIWAGVLRAFPQKAPAEGPGGFFFAHKVTDLRGLQKKAKQLS